MVIEKDTILYFSGTGNSFQVAKDISSELGEVQVSKLASMVDEKEIFVKSNILGIVFPVYNGRLPLVAEKIVKKLNISKDTYVFAVATYGGLPAGVLNKLNNMLLDNNAKLNSGFLLSMPRNSIVFFDSESLKSQNKKLKAGKKGLKKYLI